MRVGDQYRKRCKRYDEPGHAHELTFSCFRNQALLLEDDSRKCFADAVNAARNKHRFDVWAYVVMPEHVHLLVRPRENDYSVSAILKSIKQSVSRKVIARLRRESPSLLASLASGRGDSPYCFWQDGGGYDRNIRSGATLRHAIDYIHRNPVRRGLVGRPGDWLWSSFGDWELARAGPIPIDRESFALALA